MTVVEFELQGHVAHITLNRPEARNAINPEVMCRLVDAWDQVQANDDIRVAVITGTGTVFSAGADLGRLIPLITRSRQPEDEFDHRVLADKTLGDRALLRVNDLDKPVIAAINGTAVAGGCELVQGTDIRVAADTARFGVQEVQRALFPGGGSTVRLPVQLPYAVAMEWLLTGELVDADRAYQLGFVNRVVPADQVMADALTIAERIAANGPIAVRAIKASVKACMGLPEREGMALESKLSAPVFRSQDAIEGPRAFMEKRTPNYTGQ
ncbi:MAG: enoyl-CoA hydratase-related protein [Acidimicrobiales bacterium]